VESTALFGLVVALLVMAAAMVVPWAADWNVRVRSFPPLHADWHPRVGPGTLPAVAVAAMVVRYGFWASALWPWYRVLTGAYLAALAWSASLALVDGLDGVGHILTTDYEYLDTARAVDDIPVTLRSYIERIPMDRSDNWPVHIAGHPPGALLFFVALVRVGLGTGLAAGSVVLLLAATTPVAVLITLRRLGAEAGARKAAPFLAVGPAAIWVAVSADGMFAAVAAWGLCCLAVSATSTGFKTVAGWGTLAGLLLGYCVMLSYGLPLLGVLAVAVLLAAGNFRPLPWAVLSASAVVIAFALAGFAWWEAFPVLRERYYDGIASRRPTIYWIWGNVAALCFSAGPMAGSAVAVTLGRGRRLREVLEAERPLVLLAGAAVISLALADASGMSKAEVERIWLPFVPWLLVGCALLPQRWQRWGLLVQAGVALVVQHLLFTGW
jgi:hypothetical protein